MQLLRAWTLPLILLLASVEGHAEPVLEYRIEGLKSAQRTNVEAWLGPAPETSAARANFMTSVRDRVERSLQALGYYRADVDLSVDRERDPWRLLIEVDLGEPVTVTSLDLQLVGGAASDPAFERLLANKPLNEGDVLHHGHYESLRDSLLSLGQRRGYFDAELVVRSVEVEPGAGEARVRLHYASGERYRIGELRLDEEILTRELLVKLQNFEPGAPYELGTLQSLQTQLQRTGYFSAITLRPVLDERANGEVPLDLELFPAKRHTIDVGIGYSTDTEERVSLTWRTPKINRHGHSQETRLEYSAINPSGRFIYNIPLTHPLNDVLQFGLRVEQNEFGDLESRQQEALVRREQRYGNWILSYHLRLLNEQWDAGPVDGNEDYLLPGVSISHKRREGPLVNPTWGFSQLYSVEATSSQMGSSVDMTRLYANWIYVLPLAERHRMVARAEAGAALLGDGQRDDLAPSLSFFAGGSQSLRGFAYQSIGNEVDLSLSDGEEREFVLGGNRLAVASLEYQYTFLKDWRGALFVDAGDAFDEGEFEANYAAGVGVHYMTPVGAIKLEVARSISEDEPSWRLHINIGAEF
ncbi:autotransporter assembly complex family protein [Haliea sp. E1-2-M8]|uniref:autotransporter assembly complex protein TamA n=1 Tax=Haliea sp. E1-2-M8 TaxID=3064706 RepID=UPI00271657C2|nr:autotransporter assembly complex family protein [Haliea sp. E1-2-M8]MDO8862863.1 autotransporter assembly complex family protein [Haliea sp. E1-2-M8]